MKDLDRVIADADYYASMLRRKVEEALFLLTPRQFSPEYHAKVEQLDKEHREAALKAQSILYSPGLLPLVGREKLPSCKKRAKLLTPEAKKILDQLHAELQSAVQKLSASKLATSDHKHALVLAHGHVYEQLHPMFKRKSLKPLPRGMKMEDHKPLPDEFDDVYQELAREVLRHRMMASTAAHLAVLEHFKESRYLFLQPTETRPRDNNEDPDRTGQVKRRYSKKRQLE
jgi:hypothetical protein